jgi:hypothetical protein
MKRISLLGAAIAFCGCSTLKTTSLRDARLLKHGQSEITGEIASTASLGRSILVLGRIDNPRVRPLYDSLDFAPPGKSDMPVLAMGFSHGLAHGFEYHLGLGTTLVPGGAMLADLAVKKRLYANGRIFLAADARIAAGATANEIDFNALPDTTRPLFAWRLASQSYEGDLTLMTLVKLFPVLSIYSNAGVTGGRLQYEFTDQRDSGAVPPIEGYADLRGFKTHAGLVLEGRYGEIAVEQGWHFYEHGYFPSVGIRWSFKDAWKE